MRDDIFIDDATTGQKIISLRKLIGDGYTQAWFENCPVRYRLFCGARSTKKSKNMMGYEPIYKILKDSRRNILIARLNDTDNRQSTFENICGCISDMGFDRLFKISKNPLTIEYKRTGQQIIFRGLNNPTSLNGITFSHGYFTDAYIDEAFEIPSYDDFRKLDGSLRGRLPPGLFFQITLCFNAWDGETWLNEEFFKGRLDDDYSTLDRPDVTYMDYFDPEYIGAFGRGLYLHKSTWKINEFRADDYDLSAYEMKRRAPEIYKVEYLGMFGNTMGAVYPEWRDELIIPMLDTVRNTSWYDFAIGIDTGLSDGEGKTKRVLKGEDPNKKIRAATTMVLVGITQDLSKAIPIVEYFHSNNKADNATNTDNRDAYGLPEQCDVLIQYILKWQQQLGDISSSILMKGQINIYVDSGDVGARQVLEMKANEYGLYNLRFMASTKKSIQSRIDFDRLLMAYGDYNVCDSCPNLIREIKNAQKGKKGEPRADGNDHCKNAEEYAKAPLISTLKRYKTFKEH